MTRSQRSAVATAVPAAVRRTVLLTEAADRLGTGGGPALVVVPGTGPADDVEDPFGRSRAEIVTVLDRIEVEVGRLARALLAALA